MSQQKKKFMTETEMLDALFAGERVRVSVWDPSSYIFYDDRRIIDESINDCSEDFASWLWDLRQMRYSRTGSWELWKNPSQSVIKKYRKRTIVIEAVRLPELKNCEYEEIRNWMGDCGTGDGSSILIDTLEGTMRANPGDWIIKGIKGEFYPCKHDVFINLYDEEKTE